MNKVKAGILAIAVIFLGFVGYNSFSLPLPASGFNLDAVYRGDQLSAIKDPKEYYNELNNLNFSGKEEDMCDASVKVDLSASKKFKDTDNFWFLSHFGTEGEDEASIIGKDGSGLLKSGDKIYNPITNMVAFKNSNTYNSSMVKDTGGKHDIEIIIDDKTIIVFKDIMTWWCHAHKPSQNIQHDVVVGKDQKLSPGAVIGIANTATTICVYQVKEEFSKGGTTIDKVTNYDQLEQIHAGSYLAKNERTKV